MKLNFSLTVLYFLCLGISMVVCPGIKYSNCNSMVTSKVQKLEERPIAKEDIDVLHSELLFR